ncbi:hypothetical protein JOD63_001507 [Microbacterium terrae]|uniref:GGDEF domain-containing protein n=1 Tax=Microbacterium terrae TaxID=69369 RepID=A0A0M2H3A7_9MICO|nr:hypothetical protein [Microbacterium terrae]KJL38126.1 hypothetical protein RS81_03124 [Microbacterium terrae]MBP1077539.1 hypothetical protein [Microbacterium terrae]GLJ99144.1 hypothetical protein GCM10017594_23410 [Microbacterium terrae]
MSLDVMSVMVMTALVVNISGILFISETLLRRDEGAGRVWAIGYLLAMLTTLAYVIWSQDAAARWPIAVGNAAFVAGTGAMWLGCRRFNERPMLWSSLLVAGAAIGAAVAVVLAGPDGGDWAGAVWMFVSLLLFSAFGAVECLRGDLRESRSALVLGIVLIIEAVFFVARTTVFLASGPESALFQAAFGTVPMSFLTVTLTIVAVVVTSVLRATRAPMRGQVRRAGLGTARDGILSADVFGGAIGELCHRAALRGETVAVTAVRIDDLDQISTAFGSEVAHATEDAFRGGVRRHAPSNAFVAEDGQTGLLVGTLVDSPQHARRQAAAVYGALFDDLGRVGGGVLPVIGVGVALSDSTGYDGAALTAAARDAAVTAAATLESSVLVADAD